MPSRRMTEMKSGNLDRALLPFINKLTGWQRHQWAKAHYPADLQSLKAFAKRVHGVPVRKPRRRKAAVQTYDVGEASLIMEGKVIGHSVRRGQVVEANVNLQAAKQVKGWCEPLHIKD